MPKLLTTKQAQWLVSKIDIEYLSAIDAETALKDVLIAIHQCTEKEFPEYCFEAAPGLPGLSLSLSLFEKGEYSDNRIMIKIVDGEELSINLYPAEFKQFIEGCAKISQWLDEQS